jgi:NTP pyrophosphatase (non-canonical NTP hydrolase)
MSFAHMAHQYPQRSVSLGIATNYPPGPCTRCQKHKCECPPGQFKVARPTINPAWLRESIYSVQVRMRKLYHGGNMLNGGRWNVACRFLLEVHEALDDDMLEMAALVQRLVAGDTSHLSLDPDQGRMEEELVEKSIEFGDVMLWLAVLANALDVPLALVADREWDMASYVFADEVALAQGEFQTAEETRTDA